MSYPVVSVMKSKDLRMIGVQADSVNDLYTGDYEQVQYANEELYNEEWMN